MHNSTYYIKTILFIEMQILECAFWHVIISDNWRTS